MDTAASGIGKQIKHRAGSCPEMAGASAHQQLGHLDVPFPAPTHKHPQRKEGR